ncbi:hypothetical protein WA538_000717 [Blastocystis sp. DL]
MTAIVLTASASTLSSYLIEEFNVSSLPLPQGIGRVSAKATGSFFVKILSSLVKKVFLACSKTFTHACVLGDQYQQTYEIEFDSISNIRFKKYRGEYFARKFEEELKLALESEEGVAPLFAEKKEEKEEKVPSSLPHFMMATVASLKKQKPSVKKEEKEEKEAVASPAKQEKEETSESLSKGSLSPAKKAEINPKPVMSSAATERKEERKGGRIPHYMLATTASLKKQQPPVKKEEKKEEKKMEEKRRVVSVPYVKKEKMEAGIPSYMRSTASSRAMDQTRPLKKEEKRIVPSCAMKKEMRREGEAPHYLQPTAASLALNQMTQKKEEKKMVVPLHDSVPVSVVHASEGVKRENKRCPHYLSATVASRARDMPTKQYVKRESRLPPRMMLRKRTMSSSEASEEEKKISSGPGKSISSSPERVSSEALKQKEEEKRGKEEKKKAMPVIKTSPCVAIKKASTNPPTKILTFVTCRRGGDVSTSSDEELDRELLALSHKDNPCPCERE